ncbi:hypothetical protein ACJJTC_012616 [Scirpophaga incertulas]
MSDLNVPASIDNFLSQVSALTATAAQISGELRDPRIGKTLSQIAFLLQAVIGQLASPSAASSSLTPVGTPSEETSGEAAMESSDALCTVQPERVEPQTLNKLRFALPTDQLAKAFVPESKRLSEKGFRDLKLKMLDWAFSRTLITSPPYICNRIRGSAAATEIFNEVVRTNRPMSRRNKTDRALSIETEYALSGTRKRQYSTDRETNDSWQNDKAKRSRIDALEHRVNDMFPTIMERFDLLAASNIGLNSSVELSSDDDNDNIPTYTRSESPDDWNAPPINVGLGLEQMPQNLQDFDFLPETMEIEQNIPYGRGCMIFNRPISHHPKRGHQSGPSQQQKQNPSFHTRPLQNQKRKPISDRGNKGSDRKGQRQLRRRY